MSSLPDVDTSSSSYQLLSCPTCIAHLQAWRPLCAAKVHVQLQMLGAHVRLEPSPYRQLMPAESMNGLDVARGASGTHGRT
eukprot:5763360-Amphidinium_carterae.2